jgi:protein ImuB
VTPGRQGLSLYAVNRAAAALGLTGNPTGGQTLTDARISVPNLASSTASPEADAKALIRLAGWCSQFSPWTNVDDPQGLWLDISGCADLFGGETAMIQKLIRKLAGLGITARAGLADTPGAAWAMARYGAGPEPWDNIIPASGLEKGLVALPVEGLRINPATALLLRRLGLYTIGALIALPRASLKRRFPSREATEKVLMRLDQALGLTAEPLSPLTPPAPYRSRIALAEPVQTLEVINHHLEALMDNLSALLARHEMGARNLTLSAYLVDGRVEQLSIALGRPSREISHFRRLFAEKIETINPGFGIEAMILGAGVTQPLPARQLSLTPHGHKAADDGLDQLIDRLSNRLGPDHVLRRHPHASHIPERAQKRAAALVAVPQEHNWQNGEIRRPHRLLPHPEPIDVMAEVPEGPPLRFSWRRILHLVAKAEGPERIAPEWWRAAGGIPPLSRDYAHSRDYYLVEDEKGRRFWLYRQGLYAHAGLRIGAMERLPKWFLHGFFA